MSMSPPHLLGLATVAVAVVLIYAVALRKQPRKVWLFALVLLAVGLGYLATTPAPTDIARFVFGQQY